MQIPWARVPPHAPKTPSTSGCGLADVLEIVDRDPPSGALASLAGFRLRDGGQTDSRVVIEHGHITPYCLDHQTRRLIFTDLPPDLDLSSEPFAFWTQMAEARRLIAVPYAELPLLASDVETPGRLVFIFNSGRSGSTLLHQIFNEVDGAVSVSELDYFGNLVAIAHRAGDRSGLVDLLRHCITLSSSPFSDQTVAFKFRSDVTDIADLFHSAFPTAANIFLYRNAIDWCASWHRIHRAAGWPEVIPIDGFRNDRVVRTGRTTEFDQIVPPDSKEAPYNLAMLSLWSLTIQAYQRHWNAGVPMLAVRYEDLDAHRDSTLSTVLDRAGIPHEQLAQALRGFERDSQAGTVMAQADRRTNTTALDTRQRAAVVKALADLPDPLEPDIVLRGTFLPTV